MRRFLTALLMAVGLAATGVVASPQPANAACTWCSYQNLATRRCLDDSFEFGLRSFPCNGLNYQKWRYGYTAGTLGGLVNRHTGRCIDDSFEFGLRSFPCNGLAYQVWQPNPSGGTFHWGNRATGRFMDDSEFGLRSFQRNNLNYQRFVSDA